MIKVVVQEPSVLRSALAGQVTDSTEVKFGGMKEYQTNGDESLVASPLMADDKS